MTEMSDMWKCCRWCHHFEIESGRCYCPDISAKHDLDDIVDQALGIDMGDFSEMIEHQLPEDMDEDKKYSIIDNIEGYIFKRAREYGESFDGCIEIDDPGTFCCKYFY